MLVNTISDALPTDMSGGTSLERPICFEKVKDMSYFPYIVTVVFDYRMYHFLD